MQLHLLCTKKEVTVEKMGGSQVLHFQGKKNCRGLLLMQSEVQKPIWSSLGRFCRSSESVMAPNIHSVLAPELCLLFSHFHQLKEI